MEKTSSDQAQSKPSASVSSRVGLGATLVALAGLGQVGYGIMFLIRNFTDFIELGLTPEHVGSTPEQIQSFSPALYNYISHLQVALSGFMIGLGVAVIALAWYGIRRGERWALWTTLHSAVITAVVSLPLHYVYGIGTLGHLGKTSNRASETPNWTFGASSRAERRREGVFNSLLTLAASE